MRRATGAAEREPLSACSTITASAIVGASAGAKATNEARWRRCGGNGPLPAEGSRRRTRWAVPVLAAMRYGAPNALARAVPVGPCMTASIERCTASRCARLETTGAPAGGVGTGTSSPPSRLCTARSRWGGRGTPSIARVAVACASWIGVTTQ